MLPAIVVSLAGVIIAVASGETEIPYCLPDSISSVVQDGGELRFNSTLTPADNTFYNRYLQIFTDKVVPCNGILSKWHFKPTSSEINGVHLLVLRNHSNTFDVVLDTHIQNLQLPSADLWADVVNDNTDPKTYVQAGDVLGLAYDSNPTTQGGVVVRSAIDALQSDTAADYFKEAYYHRRSHYEPANTLVVPIGTLINFADLQGKIILPMLPSVFEWRQAFLDADIKSYLTTSTSTTTTKAPEPTPESTTQTLEPSPTITEVATWTKTSTTEQSLQVKSQILAQRCSSMTSSADLMCSQQQKRYRYDFESGSCQAFDGCLPRFDSASSLGKPYANGDGGNNFNTWVDCVRACSIFRCGQYPISATNVFPCRERRWYFNVQIGHCQTFVGCDAGPERNNFGSENECMHFCTAYPFVSNWRPIIESRSASQNKQQHINPVQSDNNSSSTRIRQQ